MNALLLHSQRKQTAGRR